VGAARMTNTTIEIDGISTRFQCVGSGEPVLVLHGWGAKIEAVAPIVGALSVGRAVYAPDLPGFGETGLPPEPWGIADYTRWTLALLDHLGLDRVSIIGHSNGGRIAIYLASHHPQRVEKLILVDSAGIRPKRGLKYYRRVGLAKAAKHVGPRLGPAGRRLQQRVAARVASSDYASAGALRPTFVKIVNEDLTSLLPKISAPTLLVWGAQDTSTPLADGRTMERLIPDAGLVVFDNAGHFSYLDEPDRFGRIAAHFLFERAVA
jgi:pimeloyl-ACP methyl ester carboxylesterase